MKSIIQNKRVCYICGNTKFLENHHIFEGAYRQASERHGLKVYLCPAHHRGIDGAHGDPLIRKLLKRAAQQKFEERHGREEFIREFGQSFL